LLLPLPVTTVEMLMPESAEVYDVSVVSAAVSAESAVPAASDATPWLAS